MLLPCENDQAKPDRFSRLARSTNLSKILESIRLSGPFQDRGPGCDAGVSSNLLRSPKVASYSLIRRFCANLLKLSKFQLQVKLNLIFLTGRKEEIPFQSFALRKISNNDQQKCTGAARARRRYFSWVLQWLVLSRDSLQGLRGFVPHLTQRTKSITGFPLPSTGQAIRPPGGFYRSSATSQQYHTPHFIANLCA